MRELTTYTEFSETMNQNGWLLAYFNTSWCSPCVEYTPVVEEASKSFSKIINTVKVDIENVPETAGQFHIRSVPTLLLIHNGKVVEGAVGSQSLSQLTQWITSHVLVYI